MQDPYASPITPCPDCNRKVCLTTAGNVVRHKRPEDVGLSWMEYCSGSGVTVVQTFSPATAAIMGGADSAPTDSLCDWWVGVAADDIARTEAKIHDYGGRGAAIDLLSIGRDLAMTMGRAVSDEEAIELGIYFYTRGKLARWTAAVMEGRRPSPDTLLDLTFYAMMARRNQAVGGWPYRSQTPGTGKG